MLAGVIRHQFVEASLNALVLVHSEPLLNIVHSALRVHAAIADDFGRAAHG